MSTQEQKRYDPNDTTLKFVDRPDDLDPFSDESLRAEMSCGHAVTPESLTGWCRSLLNQGRYPFKCPASKEGTHKKCEAQWSYPEVRRLAMLTSEERQEFEEAIAHISAENDSKFGTCPGCQSYVERKDPNNLNVQCPVCTADKKKAYQFCWQCLMPWKGPAPRSDRCDNDGCIGHILELLRTCNTIVLPNMRGVVSCPSIRVCPTCGQRVEHSTMGCKYIRCPGCKVTFCFVCLKLIHECGRTISNTGLCSHGVAPRQTSIPVWHRGAARSILLGPPIAGHKAGRKF